MPEAEHISAMMWQKRTQEGKAQAEFADEIGISERQYRKVEQGNGNPWLKTLKGFADSYGMTVSEFLRHAPPYIADSSAWPDKPPDVDTSAELAAISLWLHVFRQRTGETQMSLAAKAGKCIDTVGDLERQKSEMNPRLDTLQALVAYMGIEVWELLDTTLSESDMERVLRERLGDES